LLRTRINFTACAWPPPRPRKAASSQPQCRRRTWSLAGCCGGRGPSARRRWRHRSRSRTDRRAGDACQPTLGSLSFAAAVPGLAVRVGPCHRRLSGHECRAYRQFALHHQPPPFSRPSSVDISTYESRNGAQAGLLIRRVGGYSPAGASAKRGGGPDSECMMPRWRWLSYRLSGDRGNLPGFQHTRIMVKATCERRGLQRWSTSPGAG
jgi:hypothetical protein